MQQLTFLNPGELEWRDVPEPRITDGKQAIVRPLAAGRCDLDYYALRGAIPLPGPYAIGHEIVGEIVEVGSTVTGFRVGERVAVPCNISCGQCGRCDRGLTARCETSGGSAYGAPESFGGVFGGGLSDFILVPFADAMLVGIPDGVDLATVACLGDNLTDAYRAVGPFLEEDPDQSVLIVGGISIGLYAAAIAKALGSPRVDYMDSKPHQLEMAESLGVGVIDAPLDTPVRDQYRIVIEASARVPGLDYALRSLEPGGVCTSTTAHFNEKIPIPFMTMYLTDATLKVGLAHSRPMMDKVLDLIVAGRFRPESFTTTIVPWEEAAERYGERSTKLVVTRET